MKLKDETVLIIGMLSFVSGILIGRFFYFECFGLSMSDFIEGVLYGLSFVMNIFFLIKKSTRLDTKS